jgi:hypothetical protein
MHELNKKQRNGNDKMENTINNVMNRTIRAKHMECTMSPMDNNHMTCNFINDHGVAAEINHVSVYHVDLLQPQLDVHRDKSTGDAVIAVHSNETMACDVMGEPARGVTVRCRE